MTGLSTATDQGRSDSRLFGQLHLDLFRLLAGPATRVFYADLLEHLETEVFSWSAGAVPQGDVIAALREFVDRRGRGVPLEEEAGTDGGSAPDSRAHIAYRRLIETGWLIEHRDRYRKVVDFDGYARIVLQLLLDIKAGRTRSFGGEVLGVLSNLEAALGDPRSRSEGIRNAARAARSFVNHLRSVASAMRTIEQQVSGTTELALMFQRFFEDFVAQHLVEDYKRLHTDANPFRFSVRIVETSEQILGNALILDTLGDGYVAEGRAADILDARAVIEDELRSVMRVFDAFEQHMQLIDAVNRRIEGRVRNTVRHMDRIGDARTEDIVAAMVAVGRAAVTTLPGGPLPLLLDAPPLGPAHLFQNARRRSPPERRPIRRSAPDPAFLAFQEALQAYRERMDVTPAKARAYLDRALDGRKEARASELPLATLDDFVVFERLAVLPWLGDGDLTSQYTIQQLPGPQFCNDWLSCADFIVTRRVGAQADG
ncbi:Wadjet anti-phage system protein JetA family protein [Falsiroseomonas sp. HW251]|uniref:Wadjet anti-phage system protein JetA family protein n=1 Tax=Falsiroseomonas sp. HW251 TaxID=3390998 RepID=UPI003D310ACC